MVLSNRKRTLHDRVPVLSPSLELELTLHFMKKIIPLKTRLVFALQETERTFREAALISALM